MSSSRSDIPADLLTNFDIVADPLLAGEPQKRLHDVFMADPRPIQYSPHNGGHWIITSYAMAHEILCDARTFGSFPIGVPANFTQRPRLIPLESDIDEHRRYRRLLLPVFSPEAVHQLEHSVRAKTASILDKNLCNGEIDFLKAIAKPIPTQLFANQMGLKEEDLETFYLWENGFYRAPTEEERVQCGENIALHLHRVVLEHQDQPKDDIVSLLLNSEVDGERLTTDEVNSICFLLFLAGIDTVAAMTSFIALHLARDPKLWVQMRASNDVLEQSIDELLRIHSFINLNRIVSEDTIFHGVEFKKGDNVVIPSYITNRDDRVFANPNHFDNNRSASERKRHHAFGAGAHKCIGLHLAKLEVRVILQELAKRVESFHLTDASQIRGHGGTTMGLDCLPLTVSLAHS